MKTVTTLAAYLFVVATSLIAEQVPIIKGRNIPMGETASDRPVWRRSNGGFFMTANAVKKVSLDVPLSEKEALAFERDGHTLKPEVLGAMRWAIANNETDIDDALQLRDAYDALLRER